jgi:hypothetical protein
MVSSQLVYYFLFDSFLTRSLTVLVLLFLLEGRFSCYDRQVWLALVDRDRGLCR